MNAEGHPYYANLAAINLLGKGVSPTASLDHLNVIYQAYQAGTNQLYPLTEHPFLRAFQGETQTIDDLEIHQGGQIIPLEVTATPVLNERGDIAFILAILQDLRPRQAQSQRQEQLHQELIRRNRGLQQENDSLKTKVQLLQQQLDRLAQSA